MPFFNFIKQGEYYREVLGTYKIYQRQKPKDKAEFFEDFCRELTLFNAAKKYFDGQHFDKSKPLPIKEWKAESAKLKERQTRLYPGYLYLKKETRSVENIKRGVVNLKRDVGLDTRQKRAHGMEH